MTGKYLLLLLMLSVSLLNAQTRPKLSTNTDEYWYYIQFRAGGGVIQDMGNNANLLIKAKVDGQSSQLWKLTGEYNNYTIVNKEGRKMDYTSERFSASTSSTVKFALVSTSNASYAPAWELKRTGQSGCMNQWGGSGSDKELGQWNAGDDNNVLLFIAEDPLKELIPEISNATKKYWYYIQFKRGGAVLQDMGAGEELKTKAPRNQKSQLWKVTKEDGRYVIESKQGNKIIYSGNYFQASATDKTLFDIRPTSNTTYSLALELQRAGSDNCMNQWEGGLRLDRKLGEWAYGDPNNPLLFISQSEMKDLQDETGKLLEYVGCAKIKSLSLPVCTAIGECAFIACSSLEELSFPYSDPPAYGVAAFATPGNISIKLDDQDIDIVQKWQKIEEWNAFNWKPVSNIENKNAPQWKISIFGNHLMLSGLIPGIEVRLISSTGTQKRLTASADGEVSITLPFGFYIVNQRDQSQKIIIAK